MPTVIVVNKDLQGDIAIRGYKDLLQPVLKDVSHILIQIQQRRVINICVPFIV